MGSIFKIIIIYVYNILILWIYHMLKNIYEKNQNIHLVDCDPKQTQLTGN